MFQFSICRLFWKYMKIYENMWKYVKISTGRRGRAKKRRVVVPLGRKHWENRSCKFMTRIKYHQLLKKCEVLNDVFYFDVMFKELLFQSDLDIESAIHRDAHTHTDESWVQSRRRNLDISKWCPWYEKPTNLLLEYEIYYECPWLSVSTKRFQESWQIVHDAVASLRIPQNISFSMTQKPRWLQQAIRWIGISLTSCTANSFQRGMPTSPRSLVSKATLQECQSPEQNDPYYSVLCSRAQATVGRISEDIISIIAITWDSFKNCGTWTWNIFWIIVNFRMKRSVAEHTFEHILSAINSAFRSKANELVGAKSRLSSSVNVPLFSKNTKQNRILMNIQ